MDLLTKFIKLNLHHSLIYKKIAPYFINFVFHTTKLKFSCRMGDDNTHYQFDLIKFSGTL